MTKLFLSALDGVTDAPLGIIEPEEKITIGDDITVICAASIYNFSSVQWLDENDQPIQNSGLLFECFIFDF